MTINVGKALFIMLMIWLGLTGLIYIGSEYKQPTTKKVLCVDGEGNVNLEGIMCEEKVEYFFGYSLDQGIGVGLYFFMVLLSIFIIPFIAIFIIAFFDEVFQK